MVFQHKLYRPILLCNRIQTHSCCTHRIQLLSTAVHTQRVQNVSTSRQLYFIMFNICSESNSYYCVFCDLQGVAAVVTSSGLSGYHEHYPHLHDCSVARLSSRGTFKSYFDGALQKLQCSLRHTQGSVSRQEKCMEELEMKVLSLGQQTVGLSEDTKSMLGQMETSVNDHGNQMDSLENSVSGNTDRIDSLEASVGGNTDRIDSLEASIQSLLGCKDQSRKLQSTDNIRTQLKGLSASMDSTHEHLLCSLDSLEGRLANLESSVTTMTERVESVML